MIKQGLLATGLAALMLSGCASVYEFTPKPSGTQSTALRNTVLAQPVQTRQVPFNRMQFQITVTNGLSEPIEFSTKNIEAQLNGQPAVVMSYEDQRAEAMNTLHRYLPAWYPISFNFGRFGYSPYGWGLGGNSIAFGYHQQPFVYHRVDFDASLDALDIQRALDDLDHIQKYAIKPTIIQPGAVYSGELTLGSKLNASESQNVSLTVKLGPEAHTFDFAVNKVN